MKNKTKLTVKQFDKISNMWTRECKCRKIFHSRQQSDMDLCFTCYSFVNRDRKSDLWSEYVKLTRP